jgi:hypothetical protein
MMMGPDLNRLLQRYGHRRGRAAGSGEPGAADTRERVVTGPFSIAHAGMAALGPPVLRGIRASMPKSIFALFPASSGPFFGELPGIRETYALTATVATYTPFVAVLSWIGLSNSTTWPSTL